MGAGPNQGEPIVIEFFAMGGYAVYVWPSFLLTAVVMAINFLSARRRQKKVIASLLQSGGSSNK